jgi:hypothetical protein
MVFLRLFVIESSFHLGQPTAIEVDPIAQSKRPNRSSARDQTFGKLRHNHSHQDDKGQKEKINEDKGSLRSLRCVEP